MSNETVGVIINGRKFSVSAGTALSFQDVSDLAGFRPTSLPTIVVKAKGREGRTVIPGESVMPVDGMVFNVADTSNA